MSGNLRSEVINAFKKLHRTRLKTFQGDKRSLEVVRCHITNEFRRNKDVIQESAIKELIKFANEVEHEIRTTVIQAVEKKPGLFEARITKDIKLLDNVPYGQTVDKSAFKNMQKCCDPPKKKT